MKNWVSQVFSSLPVDRTLMARDVILGVLTKAASCIRELVLDGTPVKLADLCIFTPAVTTRPANDVDSFTLTRATRAGDGTYTGGNLVSVRMQCRATGEAKQARMTEDAELGYTSLAQKIKSGELTLSSVKGEYISGVGSGSGNSSGWGDEPVVNP